MRSGDPAALAALCATVASLPPQHIPTYRIPHRMNAMTGAQGDPLVTPVDAAATWAAARKEYMNCP